MIRLSTFGKIDLRDSTGLPVTSVLSQPRRLALLIFLCTEGRGRRVRRDVLLGAFWPEHPQEKARHALSQAIHFLRQRLGPDLITGQGSDELGVSDAELSCDAWDFLAAIEAGRFETAVQLYQGDFLPGFFVDAAPDFEQWMELRRSAFRRSAEDAAWQLAVTEELVGSPVAAAAWGRRSSELSNGDELALRRLISLLGRLGDRGGARQAYQNFASRLSDELGIEPGEETRLLLEQVESDRTMPENAVQRSPAETSEPHPVQAVNRSVSSAAGPSVPTAVNPAGLPRIRRKRESVMTAILSLAFFTVFVSLWGVARRDTVRETAPGRVRLVIAGAQAASAASRDLAEALTAEITGQLARIDSVDVVEHYSVRPAQPEMSNASLSSESFVLRTSILQTPERTRVNAVLIEEASGTALGRVVRDLAGTDLTALVDSAADEITAFARTQLGREMREQRWRRERSTPASRSFVRQAVRQRAYADSLRRRAAIPAAIAAYRSADSLLVLAAAEAPNWNEPTIQRGETNVRLMWTYLTPSNLSLVHARSALARGYKHAQDAIVADNEDAAAWEARGVIGHFLWLTSPPDSALRAQEFLTRAELDLRKASSIDNGRPRAWSTLGAVLEAQGSYAEANFAAKRAFESDAFLEDATETLVRLFSTSLEVGDTDSAVRWCSALRLKRPDTWIGDYCQLVLIAWKSPTVQQDVMHARKIVHESKAAGRAEPIIVARFEMIAAVIAARGGFAETARILASRARAGNAKDPELDHLEAWYLLASGRKPEAANLLNIFASANRIASASVIQSRRFRALRHDPSFATR